MVHRKCVYCEYQGRYEAISPERNILYVENYDRMWDGCKLNHNPKRCIVMDPEEVVKV